MAHLISITFLGLAKLVINNNLYQNNWMYKYNPELIQYDWITQYLYAFYWASTMMITVGFGDITPSNPIEVVFVIITMYLGCWIFAFNISSIQMIVQEIRKREIEFSKEMKVVNKLLEVREVDSDVRLEVRKYLQHRFQQQNEITKAEEDIVFNKLSNGMKEKIIISSYFKYLNNCQFLNKNFTQDFLKKLTIYTKQQTFCNNEVIFTEADPIPDDEENYIYILQKGCIQIYTGQIKDEICVIKELFNGQLFGELSFILNQKRSASARSKGTSQILMINKKDFLQLIKQYQLDYEQYCQMKDHSSINKNNFYLRIQCYICQKSGHTAMFCPKVHFIPDQEKVLLKELYYSVEQKNRQKYDRNLMKHNNSLKDLFTNNQAALNIREAYMYLYYNVQSDQPSIDNLETQSDDYNESEDCLDEEEEQEQVDDLNNPLIQGNQTQDTIKEDIQNEQVQKRQSVLLNNKQFQTIQGLVSPFLQQLDIFNINSNNKQQQQQETQILQNLPVNNSVTPEIIITPPQQQQDNTQNSPKNNNTDKIRRSSKKKTTVKNTVKNTFQRNFSLKPPEEQIQENLNQDIVQNKFQHQTSLQAKFWQKQQVNNNQLRQINNVQSQVKNASQQQIIAQHLQQIQQDTQNNQQIQNLMTQIQLQQDQQLLQIDSLIRIDFPNNLFEKVCNFKCYYIHHNLNSILAQQKLQQKVIKYIRPKQYHLFIEEVHQKNQNIQQTNSQELQMMRKKTIKQTRPIFKIITPNTQVQQQKNEIPRKSVIKMEKTEQSGDSNKNKLFIFKKIDCKTQRTFNKPD